MSLGGNVIEELKRARPKSVQDIFDAFTHGIGRGGITFSTPGQIAEIANYISFLTDLVEQKTKQLKMERLDYAESMREAQEEIAKLKEE